MQPGFLPHAPQKLFSLRSPLVFIVPRASGSFIDYLTQLLESICHSWIIHSFWNTSFLGVHDIDLSCISSSFSAPYKSSKSEDLIVNSYANGAKVLMSPPFLCLNIYFKSSWKTMVFYLSNLENWVQLQNHQTLTAWVELPPDLQPSLSLRSTSGSV